MNKLNNTSLFIRIWDDKFPQKSTNKALFKESSLRNINYKGDCSSDTALIFTKNDSLLYRSIEEGIKPLVVLLIENLGWITFSSCSGHSSFGKQAYKKRMVQLLPRNREEASQIIVILNEAIKSTHRELAYRNNPIKINILEEPLLTDGEVDYNSIKLIFGDKNMIEKSYFTYIDDATEYFCTELKRIECSASTK